MSNYYAEITWQKDKPVAKLFDDVYYSIDASVKECEYVFIKHNHLETRFSNLKDNDIFIIGDTRFGCGLNFLTVLKLWQSSVKSKAKLFFISFEKQPLTPLDLNKILKQFPELDQQISEFISQYYLPLPATHRFRFNNNVFLNLVIGDIQNILSNHDFKVDAWFIEAFNSTSNPLICDKSVFKQIARLSKPNSTFATFNSPSSINKALIEAGFQVTKSIEPNKPDILYGLYVDNLKTNPYRQHNKRPNPWFNQYTTDKSNKHIIVIGGGISGATTAYSLAKRGYHITLYEQNMDVALGASGNYQGILYGSFSPDLTPIQELSFSGYRYTHHLISNILDHKKEEYSPCGLIQLEFNDKEAKSQRYLLESKIVPDDFCYKVDRSQIKQIANIDVNYTSGLFFPYGIWLHPYTLIQRLLDQPNIKVVVGTRIDEIRKSSEWEVINNNNIIDKASNIVICNSYNIEKFESTRHLNLRKIRGQISIFKQDNFNLKTILCGSGYIIPQRLGAHTMGATFDFKNFTTNVMREDHIQNLSQAKNIIPQIANINIDNLEGQAAIRSSTYDYMPLVGPVADYENFKIVYAKLKQDKNFWLESECPYLKGLFINVAHGAKGMLTAPICSEIIADYIDNSPKPCSENLRKALHPNRIYVRELVKKLKD